MLEEEQQEVDTNENREEGSCDDETDINDDCSGNIAENLIDEY